MRPPLPRLLSLLLLAASPLAAQTRVELVPGGSGVSGQSGANAGTRPVPIGAGAAPSLSPLNASPGLAPSLAAPAANLNAAAAPAPALAAAAAPAAAAAAAPPGGPPAGGAAADGGGPGGPGYLKTLSDLGVPSDYLARVASLATPHSAISADLASSMAESAQETPARRVLVILAAALRSAPIAESYGLGRGLGARFGFSGEELIYLAQPDRFEDATNPYRAGDKPWAEAWVRRLKLAEDSALHEAMRRHQRMLAGAQEHAAILKDHPDFALLPDELKSSAGRAGQRAPADRAPPNPQAEADAKSARRYIEGIMGKRKPNARETESLLGDWLEEKGIPPRSARALAARDLLLPARGDEMARLTEALDPAIRHRAPLIDSIARSKGVPALRLQEVLRRRGLMDLARSLPDEQLERQLDIGLTAVELEEAVAGYPDNAQGDLMREIATQMSTKSGKSIEEVTRDGVFVYADFYGSTFRAATAGRDPDVKSSAMVFYVTRRDGRWRFDGYRQNRRLNYTDAELIASVKAWLVDGGVPEADLR